LQNYAEDITTVIPPLPNEKVVIVDDSPFPVSPPNATETLQVPPVSPAGGASPPPEMMPYETEEIETVDLRTIPPDILSELTPGDLPVLEDGARLLDEAKGFKMPKWRWIAAGGGLLCWDGYPWR
jgi:hypothetical protein